MSPLMKALEKSEVAHPKVEKRSIMVIGGPDIYRFPDVLTPTENVDVFYSQNFDCLLLGILSSKALHSFWVNLLFSIAFYQITDIVFLAHYPCPVLETFYRQEGLENIAEPLASSMLKMKTFIEKNIRHGASLSRSFVCQLTEVNRQALIAHPEISQLREENDLNIHTWLFDQEEQKLYLSNVDKENVVKLSEIPQKNP